MTKNSVGRISFLTFYHIVPLAKTINLCYYSTYLTSLGRCPCGGNISLSAKITEKSASSAHLLSRYAGKNTAGTFRKLAGKKYNKSFVRKLLTKGPDGVTLFLRFSRSVKKGNAGILAQRVAALLKSIFGAAVWLIPVFLIVMGMRLNLKFFLRLKKISVCLYGVGKRIFYSAFRR